MSFHMPIIFIFSKCSNISISMDWWDNILKSLGIMVRVGRVTFKLQEDVEKYATLLMTLHTPLILCTYLNCDTPVELNACLWDNN